jgi:hypothetical protein
MLAAINDAEARGNIPGLLAMLLRRAIDAVPLDQLIRGAISLSDLVG